MVLSCQRLSANGHCSRRPSPTRTLALAHHAAAHWERTAADNGWGESRARTMATHDDDEDHNELDCLVPSVSQQPTRPTPLAARTHTHSPPLTRLTTLLFDTLLNQPAMSSRLSTGALKRSSGSAANIAANRDLTTTLPMLKSGLGGGGGSTPSKQALKKQRRSVSFGGAHVRMFDKLDAAAACNAVLQSEGGEENEMEEEEMELTRSYTSRIEMMAVAHTPSPAQQQQQQGYNTDDITQTQTQPAPSMQMNIGDDEEVRIAAAPCTARHPTSARIAAELTCSRVFALLSLLCRTTMTRTW